MLLVTGQNLANSLPILPFPLNNSNVEFYVKFREMLHEIDPIVFSMQILAIGQCQDLYDPSVRADSHVYPK